MRIGSVSALVLAAFALAACEGTPTTGSSGNNATLALCGLACPDPAIEGDDATPPPLPGVDPDDDTNTNVGNTSNFTTGDTTIALQNGVLISPERSGSLSRLTLTNNPTPDLDTARIQINTRTSHNGAWPVPKTMEEFPAGTNASGGRGLGGLYKEYHFVDSGVDEELQVWTWGSSYGTQYRDVGGGGDARRQAWSFGGTRTASMPTTGSATYTGQYGATSRTWNWVDPTPAGRTVDVNNSWRIEGTSNITANFGTSRLTGTLTPTTWNARDANRVFTDVLAANPGDPNWTPFMDDTVMLNGVITGNTVSGAARLDPAGGWINGANDMYAGFFGPAGPNNEVTGVYNFLAMNPDPIGGLMPINDDARGFVQQSGVFHGCNPSCPLLPLPPP